MNSKKEICTGDGRCLMLEKKNNEYYYEKDLNFECKYKCRPIKCFNYIICKNTRPACILNARNGLCLPCAIAFDKYSDHCRMLNAINININRCSSCFKIKECIQSPTCDHYLCHECAQKSSPIFEYPEFPYPNREFEYKNDISNNRESLWLNDSTIQEWKKECNFIALHCMICPLCKKQQS